MTDLRGKKKQAPKSFLVEMEPGRLQTLQAILKSLRTIFRSSLAYSRLRKKKLGLSSFHIEMLAQLLKKPGMKVTELADLLSIHQSTCSNLIDKLKKNNLLIKERSESDQRVVRLYLTEKGSRLLAESPEPIQGLIVDALQHLPDEVNTNLEESLDMLVKAMTVIEKNAGSTPIDFDNIT